MIRLIITILMLTATSLALQSQHKIDIEVHDNGAERELFKAANTINSGLSAAVMNISSGTGNKIGQGFISVFSEDYSGNAGYAGYFDIQGATTGILLRASESTGNIRFLTGGNAVATQTRMFIDPSGAVGIGSSTPSSRLEVANGSIYVSDPNGSLILKSANNSCWTVTASNTGTLTTTQVSCP